ncbi:hypothetical protein BaRGS_00032330, partial [Batillaria attramentaria]
MGRRQTEKNPANTDEELLKGRSPGLLNSREKPRGFRKREKERKSKQTVYR